METDLLQQIGSFSNQVSTVAVLLVVVIMLFRLYSVLLTNYINDLREIAGLKTTLNWVKKPNGSNGGSNGGTEAQTAK